MRRFDIDGKSRAVDRSSLDSLRPQTVANNDARREGGWIVDRFLKMYDVRAELLSFSKLPRFERDSGSPRDQLSAGKWRRGELPRPLVVS